MSPLHEIRLLGPGDEDLLGRACRSLLEVAPEPDRCARLLAEPTFVAVVAMDGEGAPIGLVYGYVLHRPVQSDLLIHSVDVAEAHRRRGVGRAMIEALKRLAAGRGYGEMWVLTNTSNAAAMALYRNCGGVREFEDEAMFVFPIAKDWKPET